MKQEVREWRKGQRSFYFHPNSAAAVTALPGCATSVWGGRVSAWQAVSGLVSLQEEESESQGQNLQVRSLPPHQGNLHFHIHHSLLTGGKSGSRWGVGLPPPELHPSNPWEVEEATPADSSCQPARQRRGEPGTEDRRWRGEKRDEPARREDWWQEVVGAAILGDKCPAASWCETPPLSGSWIFFSACVRSGEIEPEVFQWVQLHASKNALQTCRHVVR